MKGELSNKSIIVILLVVSLLVVCITFSFLFSDIMSSNNLTVDLAKTEPIIAEATIKADEIAPISNTRFGRKKSCRRTTCFNNGKRKGNFRKYCNNVESIEYSYR